MNTGPVSDMAAALRVVSACPAPRQSATAVSVLANQTPTGVLLCTRHCFLLLSVCAVTFLLFKLKQGESVNSPSHNFYDVRTFSEDFLRRHNFVFLFLFPLFLSLLLLGFFSPFFFLMLLIFLHHFPFFRMLLIFLHHFPPFSNATDLPSSLPLSGVLC